MDTVLVIVKQVPAAFVIIPVQALLPPMSAHSPVMTAKTTLCQDNPGNCRGPEDTAQHFCQMKDQR